jgi:hypothetical protein
MPGGRNGYSLGILMSTAKVPPSYGVSGGPKNWPRRCVRSSPFPAGSTLICESLSFWMSAISLAIRLARLEAMVGAAYGGLVMLWRGGEVSMWVNGQAASRVSAGRRSALGSRGSSGRVGHAAHCVTTRKYWHGQKNRPNDSYRADLQAVLGAWSGLAAIKSTWELPSAVGELGWRWSSGAESRQV